MRRRPVHQQLCTWHRLRFLPAPWKTPLRRATGCSSTGSSTAGQRPTRYRSHRFAFRIFECPDSAASNAGTSSSSIGPGDRDQVEKPKQMWYLKRCIGLPGDTIRIDQRAVYVNGQKLQNPAHSKFLRSFSEPAGSWNPQIFPRGAKFSEDNYGPIVVPQKGMTLLLKPENFDSWDVFIQREGHSAAMVGGQDPY